MIIGLRRIRDAIERIAPSPAAVCVTGESGSGKEVVARALHDSSGRTGPFVALNCAAIPESLFEAELFGHVRGAFTGAIGTRVGAFESAHNGTLFLDELGELPRSLQPKLLRVLERSEVVKLGSNEVRKVSVRIVTATNLTLEEEVSAGRFRPDLYYRLRVFHILVPPLRARPEDIAPLAEHYLAGRARLTPHAVDKLVAYPWPGNVRELVNVLEAAVLFSGGVIGPEHLQVQVALDESQIMPYRDAKAQFENEYYARLLREARGNVSLASKLAQKTRKEVYTALRRIGLAPDEYR